jgi:DNA-binding MarR family transcriptional regulator
MTYQRKTRFPGETEWRRANMSRLLFSAAWLFDARILAFVNENGFPRVRMAHLHVPRNLDLRGTRLTDLAVRAAISKQSMAEIVDECEAMDLVRRIPDRTDRRAKLVAFTATGLRLMKVVRAALAAAEDDMARQIGTKRMRMLGAALGGYLERASATPGAAAAPHRRAAGVSRSR